MINLLAAATLDLNEAWNLSWGEGIQFIPVSYTHLRAHET